MSSGRMNGINWVLEPDKFLSLQEAIMLLETARVRAETARVQGHKIPVRDYFVIDLALSTGLRVMETAQLNCGDVFIQDDIYSLLVRKYKGGKKRLVRFDGSFKRHYDEYIRWKQTVGEPTALGDPLLSSSVTGGHMSTRAIEKAFKRIAARAGLFFSLLHSLSAPYICVSNLQSQPL